MNNDWLDIDVLEDYLDGKLDAKAMHLVERRAMEDPFMAEALEGLRQSSKRKENLSMLQKRLYHRIANEPVKRKIWGITTQRLSIAATATVAFIVVSILYFMMESNRRNEIAERKAKGVIVNLDTNTATAAVKASGGNTSRESDETASRVLIDKVISNSKSGALAANRKSRPVIKNAEREVQGYHLPAVSGNEIVAKELKAETQEVYKKNRAEAAAVQLTPAPASAANSVIFNGNVIAQNSGLPVQGAIVKIAGSRNLTTTDIHGNFSLPADSSSKNNNIIVNAIGFKDVAVSGSTDPDAIRNALSGDKSLNEIALIIGSNGRKKENIFTSKIVLRAEQNLDGRLSGEITKPVPASTIDYNQYLLNNNKLYNPKGPEQYVILRFKIKRNGRPAHLEVIKSLNQNADNEARRLVQNGPDWILPKKGTDTVELSVKF